MTFNRREKNLDWDQYLDYYTLERGINYLEDINDIFNDPGELLVES